MNHTPTPWTYIASNCSNFVHIETDTDHSTIATLAKGTKSQKEANAAFIVRACNAHDAMIHALNEFLEVGPYVSNADSIAPALVAACKQARAALKLARGE